MKRNFSNFLDAYVEYASDDFCPPQFHLWAGLSLIAGALERKVWVTPAQITMYPNIFCLLVSHPSTGKSTALDRAVDLLEEMKRLGNPEFKIIPNQVTEPGLIDVMKRLNAIQIGSTIVQYSAGYFHASEASASALQNLHGDFNACITQFYDCPKVFRKKIKMESSVTEIPNICFNVLAGSTFDYLKELVNSETILGGLASRFIYVIHRDRIVRNPSWNSGARKLDSSTRVGLIDDLARINKLIGVMHPTPGFIKCWEEWQPNFDRYLIDLKSPRMESLMARKSTNLLKVCMLLSVAEGNTMQLNESHWERALKIMDEVTKDNAFVLSSAIIAKTDTQAGLNQLILQTIKNRGGRLKMAELRAAIFRQGNDVTRFDPTFNFLRESGQIELDIVGAVSYVKLLVDADASL